LSTAVLGQCFDLFIIRLPSEIYQYKLNLLTIQICV